VDADDGEDLWIDCWARPKQVYKGLTRDRWHGDDDDDDDHDDESVQIA